MAMYKLNKLQFYFIDDSGWRLEIKKYPCLTEVGAWAGTPFFIEVTANGESGNDPNGLVFILKK